MEQNIIIKDEDTENQGSPIEEPFVFINCGVTESQVEIETVSVPKYIKKFETSSTNNNYTESTSDNCDDSDRKSKKVSSTCSKMPVGETKASVGKKELSCLQCPFTTHNGKSLVMHINNTHKVEHLKCEICSKVFKQKHNLDHHIVAFHKDKINDLKKVITNKIHKCPLCNYQSIQRANIGPHLRRVHKYSDTPQLSCDKCDFKTYRKDTFKIHSQSHLEVQPFICSVCNQGFHIRPRYDEHILRLHVDNVELVSKIKTKVHTCSMCGYKTTLLRLIKSHSDKCAKSNDKCVKSEFLIVDSVVNSDSSVAKVEVS